jgi:bifunctional non-homologous end joining protein LigD
MPAVRYEAMLATLGSAVPPGPAWVHELKWDGFRVLARLEGGSVAMWSRNGLDATHRFPAVAAALPEALGGRDAVVDGEVCALDERGRPSFQLLQRGQGQLAYFVFDVLELDGRAQLSRPLVERHAALRELVVEGGLVRVSETFEDGAALFAQATEERREGIMSKRTDSLYRPGVRTRDWVKVKVRVTDVLAIAGWTRGQGARARFGALVLAARDGKGLVYAGNVGTGFDDAEIDRLLERLRPLERPTSPLAQPIRNARVRQGSVTWVEPKLRARIEMAEWTNDGRVRSPAYKGLAGAREPVAEVPKRL